MNEFINILKYRLVWLNFLLCCLVGMIAFYEFRAGGLLFILISNLFDILGYHFSLIRRMNQLPEKIIIRSYRINQFLFDLLLLTLIGFLFDWIIALSGWIMKLFGLQDILYYIFLQKKLPAKWTWMKWTPLGFFKGNLTKNEILIQSVIGILVAIILLILR
jgi:hypothetical protein